VSNAKDTSTPGRPDDTVHARAADETEELALIAAGFPAFSFWRATRHGSAPRYVAQSTSLDSHPHTVITDDLGELRTALAEGRDGRPGRDDQSLTA
jgi:hypothetical protein